MTRTCHSEYLELETVFVKSAADAFIDEQKAQQEWKSLNYIHPPNVTAARQESLHFAELLSQTSAKVLHFSKDTSLSLDSIYCRDASIATDYGMIICNMGKLLRKGEPASQLRDYLKNDIDILGTIQPPGTVEGGDVAWLNESTLAVGLTYRTNLEGVQQLEGLLAPRGVRVITVPLPHYKGPSDVFHLMSILSPVDKDLAVVYSPLMPIVFRELLIRLGYQFVEVPDEEFDTMGCNVLAIAPRKCLIVKGNPKTKLGLEKAGCEVIEYEGREISVNGGGGPTCLTRPIWRLKN